MKKLTMIGMVALLMLTASCKKDKKTEIENAGSGFRATVEKHDGDGKTYLDGTAVKWSENDAIAVKSGSCSEAKRFTTLATATRADFEAAEDLPADFYTPDYTAYYPAAAFSGDQLTLPAMQTYEAGTFANGANPMAAYSDNTLLPFKNVCGLLEFQLYNTMGGSVKSITLTSKKDGEKLWGTGTVTLTDGIPTLGTLSGGGNALTLDCGDGVAMSTSPSAPSIFYFVVPAGTLSEGFEVTVTNTTGITWAKTAPALEQNQVSRSKITVMPILEARTPVVPSEATLSVGCVDCTYSVSGTVTVPSEVACEFGVVYSATNSLPTISDSKLVAGNTTINGTQPFTVDITGLTVDEIYYVRAYASTLDGVVYGSQVRTMSYSPNPINLPEDWTNGKNPHPFTVASGKVVNFAQGNLQYNASGSIPTAEPGESVGGTWHFANHQFDYIGVENAGVAQTYNGWIDFFGWGSTGNAPYSDEGYRFYQPWSTSKDPVYPIPSNCYGYGPSRNNVYGENLLVDKGSDWGANSIDNGGNASKIWRTLTSNEWNYLFNSRLNAANLYGEGKVGNCTMGLIILPDDWALPTGLSFISGKSAWLNVYTYAEWSKMEAAGAVFLPAAGYRDEKDLSTVGLGGGYYWSSSCNPVESDTFSAYSLLFYGEFLNPTYSINRYYGFSVRLVSDN